MIRSITHKTKTRRVFYALDADMRLSFDGLAEFAKKQLGVDLGAGDIVICDNNKGDKRKVMQKTEKGLVIYYARYDEDLFKKLAEHNGQLKRFASAELIE